ncbi:head maturation protease, ClpP-related [Enterococcus sp. DIV1420a]|uniref:head maturation protease, ClpP-related n=1 Tax=Enterococcus TaxID=1350 RepID=UPI003F26B44A
MPKLKSVPFEFSNEVKEGKYVLTLSGIIRKKYWSDEDVIDAKTIRSTLDSVNDDIVIKLNSPGGDAFEGIEIYNYLKEHPSKVTVEVTSQAASAATFILSAADEVIMNVGTTILIHEASTFAWGNKQAVQKVLNSLETIDEAILDIYSEKTGQTKEQLENWMKVEKRFTANEAVEYGFANSIKREQQQEEPQNVAAMIQSAVATAMANLQQPVTNQSEQKPKQKSLIARLRKGE